VIGATERVGIGVIGCGTMSGMYLENAHRLDSLEPVACADLDMANAEAKAADYNEKGCSPSRAPARWLTPADPLTVRLPNHREVVAPYPFDAPLEVLRRNPFTLVPLGRAEMTRFGRKTIG